MKQPWKKLHEKEREISCIHHDIDNEIAYYHERDIYSETHFSETEHCLCEKQREWEDMTLHVEAMKKRLLKEKDNALK